VALEPAVIELQAVQVPQPVVKRNSALAWAKPDLSWAVQLLKTCFYIAHRRARLGRALPGADVMITIFCDFRQFSAKKFAFFAKTNVMIKILHNLALFGVENANFFAEFFRENYKNHNIITCSGRGCLLRRKFLQRWLCDSSS
jgi:hypothetical protein